MARKKEELTEEEKAKKAKEEEEHKGHRLRWKKRYMKDGMASFEEYRIVEFLLYYIYPRGDVTPKAKYMLDEFGSLQALIDAEPEEIVRRCGVTEHAALLFKIIPDVHRAYLMSHYKKKELLNSPDKAGKYAMDLLSGIRLEEFHIICLDRQKYLRFPLRLSRGTSVETFVDIDMLVARVFQDGIKYVILCHNHPSGRASPSGSDISTTGKIVEALKHAQIKVLDHIIVVEGDFYSFALKRLQNLSYEV